MFKVEGIFFSNHICIYNNLLHLNLLKISYNNYFYENFLVCYLLIPLRIREKLFKNYTLG